LRLFSSVRPCLSLSLSFFPSLTLSPLSLLSYLLKQVHIALLELILQYFLIELDQPAVQLYARVAVLDKVAHLLAELLYFVEGELVRRAEEDTADLERACVHLW
jgi:hypothetical protein